MSAHGGLIVSVSGIRGVVGEGLTPQSALAFAQALGGYAGGGGGGGGRGGRASGAVPRDARGAAGGRWGGMLGEGWGVGVGCGGCGADGFFRHEPEPTAENLRQVALRVRREGVDLGLALDPDADRLALIDDSGRYVGEE